MKIWHISDTHDHHDLIKDIPEGIDVVIHSGDASNYRNTKNNEVEMRKFLPWFAELPIKHKVYIAGNHDSSIQGSRIKKEDFEHFSIDYLENSSIIIDGIKIWGSPYTPTFGEWSFMKPRHKLSTVWDLIPDDVDVLVTHGPPQGVLDLAYEFDGRTIKQCGCASLFKYVQRIHPKLHLFGHIHNSFNGKLFNAGHIQLPGSRTIYSNGSMVTDGKFGRLTSEGNIFEI